MREYNKSETELSVQPDTDSGVEIILLCKLSKVQTLALISKSRVNCRLGVEKSHSRQDSISEFSKIFAHLEPHSLFPNPNVCICTNTQFSRMDCGMRLEQEGEPGFRTVDIAAEKPQDLWGSVPLHRPSHPTTSHRGAKCAAVRLAEYRCLRSEQLSAEKHQDVSVRSAEKSFRAKRNELMPGS